MHADTKPGIIVTGATSGIGLSVAEYFVRAGLPVVGIARHGSDGFDSLCKGSDAAAPGSVFVPADVSDDSAIRAAASSVAETGIRPRAVVAAAGVNVRRAALELEDADVERMLAVNVKGVFSTFCAFADQVLAEPGGRFIAIGSVAGAHGMRLRTVYSATKAALSGLVRSLAIEWTPLGATVNCVAPGIVDTPLTRGYLDRNPQLEQMVRDATPAGRLGLAGDVASAVAFLASEGADFITGQTIGVDGGFGMGNAWW